MSNPNKHQKNIADVKKPKKNSKHFDGYVPDEKLLEAIYPDIRKPIEVKTWTPTKSFKTKTVKKYEYGRVLGASGAVQNIAVDRFKEITDPLNADIRKALTTILISDPVAAPAARYLIGAIFEDGFDLKFTLASQFDAVNNRQMTPDEINSKIQIEAANYSKFLEQLDTWKSDCDVEQLAKDLGGVGVAQGKAVGMMLPGILDLQQTELPKICEIVPADDVGNPIVDVGETRKVVAVKLETDSDDEDSVQKELLRADEMVYYVTGIRGLRREAKYHGISPLEPVMQISLALKRAYILDLPLALVNSYDGTTLIKVLKDSLDDATNERVSSFMTKLFTSTVKAMAMPDWYDSQETIDNQVHWDMWNGLENKLANALIMAIGVPKSSQNRETDLNRDIATIQAIQFARFVKKHLEKEIKKDLETQIFNPLLAHLAGRPLREIPLRIEIVRKVPEGGDIENLFDNLSAQKNSDMNSGDLTQSNPTSATNKPIGAAGTEIQTIIFDKTKFTEEQARKWLQDHNKHSAKVDVTEDSLRFRQQEPDLFDPKSFRTIELAPGIKAVTGQKR